MRARLAHPSVGIVVPLLLNRDRSLQPNVAPLPSPTVALVQASGLSRFVPDRFQPSFGTYWRHGTEKEIQAATGAVMLVSGALWDELGGFDETTFMYAEDRDLCWRARRAGWKVWFTPAASFVHLGNATGGDRWSAAQRAERVGAAEAAMLRRHLGSGAGLLTLTTIRLGLAVRVVAARLLRRPAAARFAGSLRGFGTPDGPA
jgi:N-acetylglucosaminyl-diphospho-decaprenol L-rhamnosyltransferase